MPPFPVPPNYALRDRLHSGSLSDVRAAVRTRDGLPVVLKAYTRRATAAQECARELQILQLLDGQGAPRPLGLHTDGERPVLVLERIDGIHLTDWVTTDQPPLDAILAVTIELAEVLSRVHAARWIHRDVNPSNVLVTPETLRVHLIDFGLSRPLGSAERAGPSASGPMEGLLHFISPEQTGRMNRGCDPRSDLYSLGATLYALLCSRPPFVSEDPLELIHAHIARNPEPPRELRPDLPDALSRLVLKLLAKEPEDRYQSAKTLAEDLRALRRTLRDGGDPSDTFELATSDTKLRLHGRSKVYGRDAEIALLCETYERCATGKTEIVLIEGEPGAGKSALVSAVQQRIASSGGYLCSGKFDLYRERPYSGWVAVLDSLAHQVLIESDERVARWREKLLTALGNIARVLVDLVPDLAFVLGDVPPVPPVGPRETRARLSLAIRRMIEALATPEHPLVIFLDDLQWSDAGSRAILDDLIAEPCASRALLLIGAFRNDAPDAVASLSKHVAACKVPLQALRIGPLPIERACELLADVLSKSPEEVHGLAVEIERKTANNPLLIRQFLDYALERGLLSYQSGRGWTWDERAIAAEGIPEGAVALMTAKIDRLSVEDREALSFASCVGDEFDVDLLRDLSHTDAIALERSLFALSDAGLIVPCTKGFRFAHDRIRESAQARLSDAARARLHWDIAAWLLARIPEPERKQHAIDIVTHMNRGAAHVPRELVALHAELNFEAGKRALAAGAADSAEVYFAASRRTLASDPWSGDAMLELLLQSAECALQRRDYPAALQHLDAIDISSLEVIGRSRVAAKRVQILAVTVEPEATVAYALSEVRKLGIHWPSSLSRARVCFMIWRVVRAIGRDVRTALRPPRVLNRTGLGALLILRQNAATVGRVDGHLAVCICCFSMLHHIRYGYVVNPAFSISVFATYRYIFLGNARHAESLAQSALEWVEEASDPMDRPRVGLVVHALLRPFLMNRRRALAPIPEIAESANELGDAEWAYYALFIHAIYLSLGGEPIPRVLTTLQHLVQTARISNGQVTDLERCRAAFLVLSQVESEASLEREVAALDRERMQEAGTSGYLSTLWMLVLCVCERYDLALDVSNRVAPVLYRTSPWVHIVDHTLYRGLAYAALASSAHGRARRRHRVELSRALRLLRKWARTGPDFVHMVQLLEAEHARLRGDVDRARQRYEESNQRAKLQGYTHHAALACERCASLLTESRRLLEASGPLREAIALYRAWGADAKASALERDSHAST